jgi:hypothetical protein
MTMRDLGRRAAVLLGAAALTASFYQMRDEDAGRVLREKIEARAPVGGSDAGLADWLTSEGFKVQSMRAPVGEAVNYSEAFKTTGSPVCRKRAMVQWRTTANGTITWLDARYGFGACL